MARSIWTGSLAFGLVNVPVAVFAATEDRTIHFNQFEAGTSDRIRYQRVNERTGKQVELSSIVRGREVGDGDYVLVSDEELEAVEPGRSRTIEISDFVDLDEIDPIYFQKTYYIAPQGQDAERAYALLRDAMAETNRAGIAMFVMRGKQYLVTVRPDGDVLALETMYFADEIRDPDEELGGLPSSRSVRGRELSIATQLIDSMTTSWQPERYRDTYRERVEDLIERKRQGEEIVTESQPPEEGKVVDLMEALRQSAEAARGSRAGKDGAGRRGRQGGAARSSRQGASSKGASSKGASRKTGRRGQQGRAAGGGADVDRMSKTELAKLAADAGIQGRSKMSRDELADAVRKARRGTARSAS